MVSATYKRACHSLIEKADMCQNLEAAFSVCFNIMVAMRRCLLKSKSDLMPVSSATYSKRSPEKSFTSSSRGKIRYIGGYEVAKLRFKYSKQVQSTCYSTSTEAVQRYRMGKLCLEVLESLRISEHKLLEITEDPESLHETARKQNLNRGLTNISDGAYAVMEELVKLCLFFLNSSTIASQGSILYQFVFSNVSQNKALFGKFASLCCEEVQHISTATTCVNDPISDAMTYMLSKVDAIQQVFQEVLDKVLSVLMKQFVKDMLCTLKVAKKMEHRKQVLVKTNKTGVVAKKKTESKVASKKPAEPNTSNKWKAQVKRTNGKKRMPENTVKQNEEKENVPVEPVPSTSHENAEPVPSTSSNPNRLAKKTVSYIALADDYYSDENSDEECGSCGGLFMEGQESICCDICQKWKHRKCSGLSNPKKWKRYNQDDVEFCCPDCV